MGIPNEYLNDPILVLCWDFASQVRNGRNDQYNLGSASSTDANGYFDINISNLTDGFERMLRDGYLEIHPQKSNWYRLVL